MKALALIVFLSLFGIGFSHQAVAITVTCGCNAKCEEGYSASAVTKCTDANGTCKSEKKEDSCTLTCTKGKDKKEVAGKCEKVYTTRPIGFTHRQAQ